MSSLRIVLLGPPGAGKGTQSDRIADHFDVDHVTTGDALRANRDMATDYGTPREYMEAGELVPDPVVNEIVETALADADGFVLDGYPRNVDQAEYLEAVTVLDVVVSLAVARETLIDRLTGRRVCADCGANYHVTYDPPETDGVCDACGGELIQRDDDTEETVHERLRVYEDQTRPVVEFYEDRSDLVEVDGEGTPEEVWAAVRSAIEAAA